jgi:hypothetical protein
MTLIGTTVMTGHSPAKEANVETRELGSRNGKVAYEVRDRVPSGHARDLSKTR